MPEPSAGITVRPFRVGDEHDAHQLVEDAFDEWQQRRESYQEWARHTVERPTFAPAMSVLAFAEGQLVGAVISLDLPDAGEGYIEQVAVRRDHRDRGIARLLLRHAFRAYYRQGRRACTLVTHPETGALNLYLRLGMAVRHSSTVFRKICDPEAMFEVFAQWGPQAPPQQRPPTSNGLRIVPAVPAEPVPDATSCPFPASKSNPGHSPPPGPRRPMSTAFPSAAHGAGVRRGPVMPAGACASAPRTRRR